MEPVEPAPNWMARLRMTVVAIALGLLMTSMVTAVLWSSDNRYGFALFLGVPIVWTFCVAAWSLQVNGRATWRALFELLGWQVGAMMLAGLIMLAFRMEGSICLLMALPLVFGISLVAWAILSICFVFLGPRRLPKKIAMLSLIALFLLSGVEPLVVTPPPPFEVTSEVLVNAPPEVVWTNVLTFKDLAPPTEWYFRAGIAYPMRARIEDKGFGAVRRCEFNTGAFIEPIEVWDEPRLLHFSVAENPPPMTELNPFGKTELAHLHGYLEAVRGQFELQPMPGNQTLLRGTTWYRHNLYPASYWSVWSDYLIHHIHLRVLEHIKRCAESEHVK